MTQEKQIEPGAASIFIELEKGTITVKHGEEGNILHQILEAEKGSWSKIWDAIRSIKSTTI